MDGKSVLGPAAAACAPSSKGDAPAVGDMGRPPRHGVRSLPLVALLLAALAATADCQTSITLATTEPAVRAALLAQQAAITNWQLFVSENNVTGWDESSSICSWTGVNCADENDVLQGFDLWLACHSPDDFNPLATAASVSGDVENACKMLATGSLVDELASIANLTSIDFTNQRFSSTLPAAWGYDDAFPSLGYLLLGQGGATAYTGLLPDSWGNPLAFQSLFALSLSPSTLTGTLPASWATPGAFPHLQGLYLGGAFEQADNRPGPPVSWSTGFPQLRELDLSQNRLTGPLHELGNFSQIRILWLYGNFFSGTLPLSWSTAGSLDSLQQLDLHDNSLVGALPQWGGAGQLAWLQTLDLSSNMLTSTIPASWGPPAFQSLQWLNVTGNMMCGSVPAGFPARPPSGMAGQVCGQGADNDCLQACTPSPPPPAPASPTPSPPSPPPSPDTSSSSVPVGAIVGGVIGGLAVLAAVAFNAWHLGRRRRKRRRSSHGCGPAELLPSTHTPHSLDSIFAMVTAGKGSGKGTGPPSSALPSSSPSSPADSAGALAGSSATASRAATGGTALSSGQALLGEPPGSSSTAGGQHQAAGDDVLQYIEERLPSIKLLALEGAASAAQQQAAPALAPGLGQPPGRAMQRSGGSGGRELAPEVRQWEVEWAALRLERLIGRGSYGRVYLAFWHETPVAVKLLMSMDECSDESFILPDGIQRELQAEAALLVRLRHPSIVTFLGLSTLPPCLVTEYCSRGSLYDVLRRGLRSRERAAELTWPLRLQMALDAARGLLYLHRHSPQILHRDVKSPNLLVDEHWRVKVSDFGLSKILHNQAGTVTNSSVATNPIWASPEVISGQRPTAASDVYSFGLVLLELLTWQLPWGAEEGLQPFQIMFKVVQGERPEVPPLEQLPGPDPRNVAATLDAYCALMRECWSEEPEQRPPFSQVVPRLRAMLEAVVAGTGSGGGLQQ